MQNVASVCETIKIKQTKHSYSSTLLLAYLYVKIVWLYFTCLQTVQTLIAPTDFSLRDGIGVNCRDISQVQSNSILTVRDIYDVNVFEMSCISI